VAAVTPLDALAALLLAAGTLLTVLAGVGVLRLPDVFARMHAATKSSSLGLALVLLGAALRMRGVGDTAKLVLVIALQFLTAPVAAHLVGRAAHRAGEALDHVTEVDELAGAERPPADGPAAPGG
jgi:multicomponent Na+:H+ antiporter subunit G